MISRPIYINSFAVTLAQKLSLLDSSRSGIDIVDSVAAGRLHLEDQNALEDLRSTQKYRKLDKATLLAIHTARKLGYNSSLRTGINIGSSRGSTSVWENAHSQFLTEGSIAASTSPLTTLGNVSSWVAQDLQLQGTSFSHSITCSSCAHAILNAAAWLQSGMSEQFIAGASEASVTPFTVAQMKALGIYSKHTDEFPCKAMLEYKTENTFVLGEASAMFTLSTNENSSYAIVAAGTHIEHIESASGVTGATFAKAIKESLRHHEPEEIDSIVTHMPGTLMGDKAEYEAIRSVFGESQNIPPLANNKWLAGHTLGASAGLSVAMAIEMLKNQVVPSVPYLAASPHNKPLKTIMVLSSGFGGNAVSLLIQKM